MADEDHGGLLPGVVPGAPLWDLGSGIWHERRDPGSCLLHLVLRQGADALTFLSHHPLLRHVPLKVVKTWFDRAAVTITPPPSVATTPGTGRLKKMKHYASETLQLTVVGKQAVGRPGRRRLCTQAPASKLACRDTVVWRLTYECGRTARCEVTSSGGCACKVIFSSTPALAARQLITVTITAPHHPTLRFEPPPALEWVPRREQRDHIRALGAARVDPTNIQKQLDQLARLEDRATGLTDGATMVCMDTRRVPTTAQISSLLKDAKRIGRHLDGYARVPPWTALDRLVCGPVKAKGMCVYYRRYDDTATPDTEDDLMIMMFMSPAMLASLPGTTIVCMDAKWRLNADGAPMHALVSVRQRSTSKPGERRQHCAFDAGYHAQDATELAIIVSNRDNYFAHRVPFQALRRLMPCSDSACAHELRCVTCARGYHFETACTAPRRTFSPIVMLDKSSAARRGVVSVGLHFLLCTFHTYMAVIEYADHSLQIKDPSVLLAIVLIFKFISRGRTVDLVVARRDYCVQRVLPLLRLQHRVNISSGGGGDDGGSDADEDSDDEGDEVLARPRRRTATMLAEAALIRYIDREWVDVRHGSRWILAWTEVGRVRDAEGRALERWVLETISTNNHVERLWITVRHLRQLSGISIERL